MAGAVAVPIRKRPAAECLDKVCKRPATAPRKEEEPDLEPQSDVEEGQGLEDAEEGDFERCSELRQWIKNHSGECPRRNSGDKTERTLAQWLQIKKARRARALNNKPSGRKLTASETAHLNNIISTQRPKMPLTKDHFERCNELRQWCLSHSGERPRIRSDDKTEASLAIWLQRALIRRTRAWNNRPSARQLTASETAHLNSIVRATVTPPQVGHAATTSKLDMKSSWGVLRERCWDLGLLSHSDKQAMLARILNEENRLTTDSQVMVSDTDQEMLRTCRGT